jgi:nicotinate-nucleotide adenylyltransferase
MPRAAFKLGLIGGTFNPIHLGHLRAAEEIAETMALDRVLFLPAAAPPHKSAKPLADVAHRLAMTRLAVAGRPNFFVSDMEARRQGPSYTVDSLRELRQSHGPGLDLYFIVGEEAFLEISTWKDARRLFDLTHFVVTDRPRHDLKAIQLMLESKIEAAYRYDAGLNAFECSGKKAVFCRRITRLDICSTDIRSRLARGASVRYLVPEEVNRYIAANGLYREV